MVFTLRAPAGVTALAVIRQLVVVLTLALAVVVGAAIANSYVGDSPSPYGVCYAARGRPMPCELLGRPKPPLTPNDPQAAEQVISNLFP